MPAHFGNLVCTQVYLYKGGRICLPLKKRGFGAGWHNGYGGKVKPRESLYESAKRELFEESGVKAGRMEKRAVLNFIFLKTGEKIKSHVYWCEDFAGEPKETEEMSPFWFSKTRVPYGKMWPDDKIWFPKLLAGQSFVAKFEFLDAKPNLGEFVIETRSRV